MEKEKLLDILNDILCDLEGIGDFGDLNADELRSMHNSAGEVITALEADTNLLEDTLKDKFDMKLLKELAVFTYRAVPHREKLDDITGSQDPYEYIDLVESMIDNLND